MIVEQITEAWAAIAESEVARGLLINHCILGSRAIMEALHRCGIDADVVPVECIAANKRADRLIREQVPTSEWPPDAWSVGASIEARGVGYPGHLVVVAVEDGATFLIDSSTRQFLRPEYGILPPWAMSVEVPSSWPRSGEGMRLEHGSWVISWIPAPKLGKRHRSASDWKLGRTFYVNTMLDMITTQAGFYAGVEGVDDAAV